MTVTLSGGGPSITLHNVQEDSVDVESNVISISLFASDPGDTFLLPLGASDEGTPQGIATTNRTGGRSGLAQWAANLEAHASGPIGSSSTLTSEERGRSISGQLRSVSWETETGAPHEVQWSIEFVRGQSLTDLGLDLDLGSESSGPESTSPSDSASLAGYDLGEIISYRVTLEQDLTTLEVPQFDAGGISTDSGDNLAFGTGGTTRTFRIEGRKVGSQGALNDFDAAMRGNSGDLVNSITYNEAFPGRSLTVAIQNYNSNLLAGRPGELEYSLELIEGKQFGDFENILDMFE